MPNLPYRHVSPISPRLVSVELKANDGDPLARVYQHGRPVQYSYLNDELPLWSVQTVYSARPWAVEMPSAGLPLSWSVLLEARRRGIGLAQVTHAAGLGSTGDPTIDRLLPLPERYDVPAETAAAIETARATGGRIIAAGTTVVRALESAALATGAAPAALAAGSSTTDLVIDDRHTFSVVDGLLTGMHDPSESHFRLLSAFADQTVLLSAWTHAVDQGYHCHEFGDVSLVLTS